MAVFQKVAALWKRKNGTYSGELDLGGEIKLPVYIGQVVKQGEKSPEIALIITGLFKVEDSEKGIVAKSKLFAPPGAPERSILVFRNKKEKDSHPDLRVTLVTDDGATPAAEGDAPPF